jgi:hypothetical protein
MKTPDSRRHFQTATRHYHRHREETRGWDDWIDAEKKPGRSRRRWWIAAAISLAAAAGGLLFACGRA